MGTRWGILRWCILAACAPAWGCVRGPQAAPPTAPEPSARSASDRSLPVPYDLQEGVERASALGANLFLLDVATARAWDALAERIGPPAEHGVGHYLALMGGSDDGRPDGSVQVLFFTDEHVPRLAYRVRIGRGPRWDSDVLEQDPPGLVHEPLMTLLNARLLALEAIPTPKQAMNCVVIPQRNGQIVVYLLAATNQPNVAVLGPHYRVDIAEDGAEVDTITALSGSRLQLSTRDRAGQRLAALTITDAGTEHPTESHVFASRMANLPIYVTTGRGRWKVRASAIDYLGPR